MPPDLPPPASPLLRYLAVGLGLAALVAAVVIAQRSGWTDRLTDQQALRAIIERAGGFGPAAIVLLLALAILVSPIPSAPVAMAAGAAYGPFWGSSLVVVGSCLGATMAFLIARFLAYEHVRRWELVRGPLDWLESGHSQNWLMAAIFLTRLAPFLSFDAISYAAGLTPLRFWRFALATFFGVLPVSILLAMGGDTIVTTGLNPFVAFLVLGGVTAIPILARLAWLWLRRRREN